VATPTSYARACRASTLTHTAPRRQFVSGAAANYSWTPPARCPRYPDPISGAQAVMRSFLISRLAGDAIDMQSVKARGRFQQLSDVRFGYSDARFRMYQVTSSIPMMIFLCELLKAEAETAQGDTLLAISTDVMTILDELGQPDHNGVMPDISQIR
jgi:hypothetical protein